MSSLLRAFARLTVFALVLVSNALVFGQSTFTSQGGEYPLIGVQPGDQMQPRAAISGSGGFVVWHDNVTDEDGLGISAQRLDTSLSGSFGRFRINQQGQGDQENPSVALFSSGAAIFVWQSGSAVNSDIMARIINANGTFSTGDIRVNAPGAGVRKDAVVVVLADGNAVIIWTSVGQDGSMDGVFAQRISAVGQKLGGEFRVNQFTSYNQRNPTVAALAGGNFVVAWVTEQQRGLHKVDVYARVFNPLGVAAADEFRLNTADDICASPSVSGYANGGFLAAWSQKDSAVISNSWDIFSATFDSSGAATTVPIRLNSFVYGDQIRPRATSIGTDHLVVWTSLEQDGSREGVFGRFVAGGGLPASAEFRVNTTTASQQLQPAVASDGVGKILAVWTSFVGGTGSFDLYAQRYSAVRAVPQPAAPFVFAFTSGALSVTWPELAGFGAVQYEVYVDGGAAPVVVEDSHYLLANLTAGSAHTFRFAYRLADGRRSGLSAVASGTTWGADANNDGLPDDWQAKYWGPKVSAWPGRSNVDSDGDGATDYEEFLAGTNPLDANSVLKSKVVVDSDQLRLNWNVQPGMVYQVQVSTNLTNWANLGPPRFAAGGLDSIIIDKVQGDSFYRVLRMR